MQGFILAFDFDYLYGYATTAGCWSRGTGRITRRSSRFTTIPGTNSLINNLTGSNPSKDSCLFSFAHSLTI